MAGRLGRNPMNRIKQRIPYRVATLVSAQGTKSPVSAVILSPLQQEVWFFLFICLGFCCCCFLSVFCVFAFAGHCPHQRLWQHACLLNLIPGLVPDYQLYKCVNVADPQIQRIPTQASNLSSTVAVFRQHI